MKDQKKKAKDRYVLVYELRQDMLGKYYSPQIKKKKKVSKKR